MSQEVSSIPAIDSTLDLSGVVCPMNFVKTKLQLELMQSGQVLEVIIDRGEPVRNVP
ncbi:MAG: sulfurtransferase TusA family protein, partial [Candidatus Omnitrophica bacterium]|nr:sulfurtransferase TusA family protein [Candidatus Omnitrophota bacterium]